MMLSPSAREPPSLWGRSASTSGHWVPFLPLMSSVVIMVGETVMYETRRV